MDYLKKVFQLNLYIVVLLVFLEYLYPKRIFAFFDIRFLLIVLLLTYFLLINKEKIYGK